MKTLAMWTVLTLLVASVDAQTEIYQFYPLAATALDATTAAENGVHGDGQQQAYKSDTDGPHIDGDEVTSLSLPQVAKAEGYGEAWTTAKYTGSYSPTSPTGDYYVCQGTAHVTFHGVVDSGAPAGTFAFGAGDSHGEVGQELWAIGPGKWTGKLLFTAQFGAQPAWDFYSGPKMKSWAQGSNVEWEYNTVDGKWHASGTIYQAAIHPITGARVHSIQTINDTTEPPISGLANFPPVKTYLVSGWLTAGQKLDYGQEADTGFNFDAEYGSGVTRLVYVQSEAQVKDLIDNNP